MDSDFQAHYLTAEQAYGAGDFRTAQSIVIDLLNQLDGMAANNAEQDALLAWRAFVALLAGNIHLYGLNEPEQACGFYELVLASNPQDTLKDLAEQGLERIQERQGDATEVVAPAPAPTSPAASMLIQDPFLTQSTNKGFTGDLDTQQTTNQENKKPRNPLPLNILAPTLASDHPLGHTTDLGGHQWLASCRLRGWLTGWTRRFDESCHS